MAERFGNRLKPKKPTNWTRISVFVQIGRLLVQVIHYWLI